jgi:predicted nuclease of predicted toxin-antitoxin system
VKVLADEGVDRPIVERLRTDGHDVLYIAETEPGISDDAVLAGAVEAARLLLTCDNDFGELVFREHRATSGVLLIRLAGLGATIKAQLTAAALADHGHEMAGAFAVLTPGLVRIRRRG